MGDVVVAAFWLAWSRKSCLQERERKWLARAGSASPQTQQQPIAATKAAPATLVGLWRRVADACSLRANHQARQEWNESGSQSSITLRATAYPANWHLSPEWLNDSRQQATWTPLDVPLPPTAAPLTSAAHDLHMESELTQQARRRPAAKSESEPKLAASLEARL